MLDVLSDATKSLLGKWVLTDGAPVTNGRRQDHGIASRTRHEVGQGEARGITRSLGLG